MLRPAYFTPSFSKHAGELCHGFQIHITDRDRFDPFSLGLYLVEYIRNTHPEFSFRGESALTAEAKDQKLFIDLLLGTDEFRKGSLSADQLISTHAQKVATFKKNSEKYWLYS
jgi:uncharacterized protein YbbC (DUF1343 family)